MRQQRMNKVLQKKSMHIIQLKSPQQDASIGYFLSKRDNFVHNEFVLINCLYICNPSTEGMETWHFSPKLRLKCFFIFLCR